MFIYNGFDNIKTRHGDLIYNIRVNNIKSLVTISLCFVQNDFMKTFADGFVSVLIINKHWLITKLKLCPRFLTK